MNQKLYAVITNDDQIKEKSSSGGAITSIAKQFIANGGVVYAAELTDNFEVRHIRVHDISELYKTAGSKYVYSNLNLAIQEIQMDVDNNMNILFVGTPCQCNIIKNKFQYSNLFLIDLVCHGCSTPKYFHAYIDYLNHILGKVEEFAFRDKNAYGLSCVSSAVINGKRKMLYSPKHNYYYFYMKQDSFMECCYGCKFANLNRIGDLTAGDFWGIESIDPQVNAKDGVTAVIVNTEKGKSLIGGVVKSQIVKTKCESLDDYLPFNSSLRNGVRKGENAKQVSNLLKSDKAWMIFEKIYKIPVTDSFKGWIKCFTPAPVYGLLRKKRKG